MDGMHCQHFHNTVCHRYRTVIGLLLILGLFGHGTTIAADTPSLLGAWQSQGAAGTVHLIFQSENVLVFDGEPARYKIVNGAIRVQEENEVVNYPYAFQGKTLIISFPEGYQLKFSRVGESSPPPARATQRSETKAAAPGAVDGVELARQIAGIWWGYSGSTERKIGLCPNGVYQDYTESSYSSGSNDSLGKSTMNWGTAGQSGGVGTWRIQGDYQQGVISVQYNNGSRTTIQYRQCGETGCLLFNGNKLCRNGRCQ